MDQRTPIQVRLVTNSVVALLVATLTSTPAEAQQTASLEGSRLQPIATLDASVGNAIGDILGTKPDGRFEAVTVLQERAASLRLQVAYEGFAGNWLKGEVLRAGADGDPETITEIEVEPVELDGSGTAVVEFSLGDKVGEGDAVASSHLVLLVVKRAYNSAGAKETFVLQKQWEKTVRAENIEITVYAKALQDLTTGYASAPDPKSRPDAGRSDDEVSAEFVRLRVGTDGNYKFLTAVGGGGGNVTLQSKAGDEQTFQRAFIDEQARIGRLRTANGWHLLTIHEDGRVDATSADPADPATILHFKSNGDGAYIVEAADAATKLRVTGAAATARKGVFAQRKAARARRRAERADGAATEPLTVYHNPSVRAKPWEGRPVRAAFYFVRNAPSPARSSDAEGPSPDPSFDLDGLPTMQGYVSGRTQDTGPRIEELLGIDSQIWPDRNGGSGVFYYLPSGYFLKWDPDDAYDLSLIDEITGAEGEARVLVRARLAPRFTQLQRRAAEVLVRQAARASGMPFFDLRPMPIVRDATSSSAAEALASHHGIDDVVVQPPNDVMGDVELSWTMPANTRENFVELLRQDQAVAPQLLLQASGDGGTHRVLLHLSWEEPESYPPILWENGSFKRNETPHPMRLEGLHAMVMDRNEHVQVLSWDLSSTAPVPSGARMKMNQELTRPVVDNAFLTWVAYSVVPDAASTESAVRAITGGVSEQVRQPLTITLLDPLGVSGAERLTVFVKSAYMEAGADREVVRQFEFSQDGEVRSVPFYLGRADVDVPFEWTVRLTMPDGTQHERPVFLEGDAGLQVYVSSSKLREIFGELPAP